MKIASSLFPVSARWSFALILALRQIHLLDPTPKQQRTGNNNSKKNNNNNLLISRCFELSQLQRITSGLNTNYNNNNNRQSKDIKLEITRRRNRPNSSSKKKNNNEHTSLPVQVYVSNLHCYAGFQQVQY